jgi:hypothetical protein
MVLSPPSTALGLNSFRLASLHMLSLGLRVLVYVLGLFNRRQQTSDAARLALEKSRLALGTSYGASSSWLDLSCVLVRTGRYL